jgi:hypothetical protein
MNGLLKFAIDAHGGMERWSQLNWLAADLSVTGAIWHVKGKPDFLKNIRIKASLHTESLITHLVGQNKKFFFTPSRVTLEDQSGHLIEARNDPRSAFDGQSYETPWDDSFTKVGRKFRIANHTDTTSGLGWESGM